LYARPLEEFTSARDALAKRLRADGDRDGASQVKALRKASVTAGAINRVRARDPDRVDELLEAGVRLRAAQERMIGSGDRNGLRDASARERRLVESLVDLAAVELQAGGHAATPAIRSRAFATLHAAVGDEEVRELLAAGCLVRDYELSDLGLGFGAAGDEAGASVPERSPREREPAALSERREHDIAAARERLAQAGGARVEAGEQLATAEREARAAAKALAEAEDRLRQAASAVEQAKSALTRATERLDAARVSRDRVDEEVTERERALAALLP
jgi:hypothetical protein